MKIDGLDNDQTGEQIDGAGVATPDTVANPNPGAQDQAAPAADAKPKRPPTVRESIRAATKAVNEQRAPKADTTKETAATAEERNAQGRFAQKDKGVDPNAQPDADSKKPLQGANTGAADPSKADVAPGTWKPDARALWSQLPEQIRAEIKRTESAATANAAKIRTELEAVKQGYVEVDQVIANRKEALVKHYGSVGKGLNTLFQLSDWANRDPGAFATWLFQQTGYNPQQRGEPGQQPGQIDPRYVQLSQQVNGLTGQLQGMMAHQYQQRTASIESQIEAWSKATDEHGAVKRPHFETVREQMGKLVSGMVALNPNASFEQILDKAYAAAVHSHDELAQELQTQTEQQIAEKLEKKNRLLKAQNAQKFVNGMSPKSTVVSGGAPDPKDLRATLRHHFRAAQSEDRV